MNPELTKIEKNTKILLALATIFLVFWGMEFSGNHNSLDGFFLFLFSIPVFVIIGSLCIKQSLRLYGLGKQKLLTFLLFIFGLLLIIFPLGMSFSRKLGELLTRNQTYQTKSTFFDLIIFILALLLVYILKKTFIKNKQK